MLRIVYPICCGIDVHKTFLVACIASTNDKGVTTYKSHRFSTFTNDLRKLSAWISSNSCTQVCMESTGKYRIHMYNVLEPTCKTFQKPSPWMACFLYPFLICASCGPWFQT